MRGLIIVFSLALITMCVGCTTSFLLPTFKESRESMGNETLEEAKSAFDKIEEEISTEIQIRELKLGAPWTKEETVGPLRMAAVLTQSLGSTKDIVLDPEIRECIADEQASTNCKLIIFSDQREKRNGRGNAVLYWTKLKRVDEISSWGYKIWLVFKNEIVIHKQFEPFQDPSHIEERKRDFGNIVNYNVDVP